ncbi:hypothetical protein EH223_13735 [candidate division KSB1 bacterium]|nr:hypothetical protein [candidate division KSB1 bacterium]RQW01953.1 MAG: hypothetical protein EH223_13735 [candidate division KSB1 bacterium]
MTQKFSAPWGKGLIIMTIFASAILLGLPIFVLIKDFSENAPLYVLIGVPLPIFIGCLLFTIRGYELSDNTLAVQRLIWKTKIDLQKLRDVKVNPDAMKKSIRTFGNGGLFSFSGLFKNSELGSYRAFVTDLKKSVVLYFTNRTIVVSPDRPNEFAAMIKNMSRLS